MVKRKIILFCFLLSFEFSFGQLKFIVEDFEGMADGQKDVSKEGIYSYGGIEVSTGKELTTGTGYSGRRNLVVKWTGAETFGGFGKGINHFVDLDVENDYLNFYLYNPEGNSRDDNVRIRIEEDDNGDMKFDERTDDAWDHKVYFERKKDWQYFTIPLKEFKDSGPGGDGEFNVSYQKGILVGLRLKFLDTQWLIPGQMWYLDFFSFSKGKVPLGLSLLEPKGCSKEDYCVRGAWSDAGYDAEITLIPSNFEKQMNEKGRIGVVHFFKPLSTDGGREPNLYPDVDHTNQLIDWGYLPLITMEIQYGFMRNDKKQPGLKEIINGEFDDYFKKWAARAKAIKGPVLLRVLHEFNGDWYPWSISRNGKDPKEVAEAFRHIVNIFREQNAVNVKFVWCPNSRSIPQESWNNPMEAYPGDDFVDYVGTDIYNGAGDDGMPLWTTFRKEGIQIYFELTENFPDKPFLICETSSRERKAGEEGALQDKAEWIMDMSEALKSDFSKVRMVNWFDCYKKFKLSSSKQSLVAYEKYIWKDGYFRSEPVGFW